MWFTVALFIFCLVYALIRKVRNAEFIPQGRSRTARGQLDPTASGPATDTSAVDAPLPTQLQILALVLMMGLCTFLARIIQPMGTSIFNMQFCFFSQYILLFAVGIIARRRNWLLRIPYEFGMRWFRWALILGSLVWAAALVAIVATHTEKNVAGGWTWQSVVVCFWESFFCLGCCLGLIVAFRERFNGQGPFAKWMSDNCFAVYLFHPPVLIAVTLGMRSLTAPKPLKFLVATALATIATYAASFLAFRRIPLLRRVL